MAATHTYITGTTIASASPAVTFSSIPQTYTDLILVMSIRANSLPASFGTGIRFNSDTGTNYSRTYAYGYSGSLGQGRETNQTRVFYSSGINTASQFNLIRLEINDYSNSTTYKSILGRNNDVADVNSMSVGLWRSTSAITSITITPYDDNSTGFAVGTTLNLYGIKAA